MLEQSIDNNIHGGISGNMLTVMLVNMWTYTVSNIGYYIGLEFGCDEYINILSIFSI